jgi:hypothetical protein
MEKGKPDKVPVNPRTGELASSTNPETWGKFAQAVSCCRERKLAGLGFVLDGTCGLVGIDFDGVREPNGPWAPPKVGRIVEAMREGVDAAYAEISPSGVGFKVWVIGGAAASIAGKQFKLRMDDVDVDMEVYTTGRYFTVTGHGIAAPTITDGQRILDSLAKFKQAQEDAGAAKSGTRRKPRRARTMGRASKYEIGRVRAALSAIDCEQYQVWRDMAFALKSWGEVNDCEATARCIWDSWASRSSKSEEHSQDRLWDDTKAGVAGGITVGTLFMMAKDAGWDGDSRGEDGEEIIRFAELFDGSPPPLVDKGNRLEFPLDALPPAFADAAKAAAKAYGWDSGTVAATMLGIAAAAVVDKVAVQVNETWVEKMPLWIWPVAPTGAKKSPLLRFVDRPLRQELAADMERFEVEERLHRAVAMQAQESINKLKRTTGDNAAQIAALLMKMEDSPPSPDYFGTDVTPEGAADDMRKRQRPGRPVKLVLVTGEGSEIGNAITGHYNDGNTANAVFLKGHDGDDHSVKRKGDREKSFRLRGGLVQIVATVQPEVLAGYIGKSPLLEAEGLLPRCNFVLADYHGAKFEDAEVDAAVAAAYGDAVRKLARLPHGEHDGLHLMRLSNDATEAFGRHYDWAEQAAMNAGRMRGWMSKYTGKTIRIAGLLYLIWGHGPDEAISVETVGAAARVADWFRVQAEAVMLEHVEPGEMSLPARIVEWIISRMATKVTVRELFDSLRRNSLVGGQVKAVQDALDALSEMGYVAPLNDQWAPRGPARGGRPPSPEFAVNPHILAAGFSPWGKADAQAPSPEARAAPLTMGGGLPQEADLDAMAEGVGTSDGTEVALVKQADAGDWLAGMTLDSESWLAE